MIFRRKAVLIIHGFVGTTKDEEELFYYLNHFKKYDVYNFVLKGHDRLTNDISYQDWINDAEAHLNKLLDYGYNSIIVIGHSMGGVLASYLAYKYPKKVKKLVLLAPAFDYLAYGKGNLFENIKSSIKVIKDHSMAEVMGRTLKTSPNMLIQFMKLVSNYQDILSKVKCSLLLMHGDNDAVVPYKSSEEVFKIAISKTKYLITLEVVDHDVFRSDKTNLIFKIIYIFLKNKKSIKKINKL